MNILVGGIALYGVAVGGLYLLQDSMIFPREVAKTPSYPLPSPAEKLKLRSADGHHLAGHLLRARGRNRGLIIGFSGNAWNAQDCMTFMAARLYDFDLAVFHYRGYGESQGDPSQQALFDDALLIHDFLVEGLRPTRVYAAGFSLGSGVVSYLGRQRPIDGQLLVTPFDSIAAIAKYRYRIIPVNWLLKHPFNSVEHQRYHDTPAAVILASNDRIVPRQHSENLIASLARPVFVETIPNSTHGGIYDMDEVDTVIRDAFDALEVARVTAETGEFALEDSRP